MTSKNSDFKLELNSSGIKQLLRSTEMQNMLSGYASEIRDRCGKGYETDTRVLSTRAVASVYTDTFEAMQNNLNNNTLKKASGV